MPPKLSLSARLILVMGLIAVLTAGLSAYLILRFIDSGEQVKVLADEGTQGIIWGEKANFYLHNLIINFYRANSGDMRWVKAMEENIPKIHSALDEYAKTAHDPENKYLLSEAYDALEVYAKVIYALGKSYRQGVYGPAIIQKLNDLDTKTHANRLIIDINNLVEYSKAKAEENRVSFFTDMDANTHASIALACVVVFILVWAGYTGIIWTRDEIAEHNAKERLLEKLQADLLNSLEAAGAVSRQITFDSGTLTFVGEVEKVLEFDPETVTNLIDYAFNLHPDDRAKLFGDISWEEIGLWEQFISLFPDDFIEVEGRKLLRKDSRFAQHWIEQAGSETATHQKEFRCCSMAEGEREWRWKRCLSKLLPDPSGLGYIGESGIIFDITEEYEIRNELIRAKYDAEAASRAKSDFLARMSHEIRTPMNAIIGMSHLILRTQLSDAQMDYQNKILSSAQNLLTIINDILDFSKIEAGKMELEDISFRLDGVLNSLTDMILIKSREKGLEVVFSVSDDTPEWLVGDPLRLGQVLTNLANNAIKFTSQGEILVKVEVIEQIEQDVELHFSVTDSGIGLTDEQVRSLFQPFSQADGSITRRFGGTGLGLAICKSLVEAMDGRIWAESQPEKGSTFHFTVRLALAPDRQEQLFLPQDLRRLRTLVIDDNSTACNSLAEMLGTLFSVKPDKASSFDNALEKITVQNKTAIPYDLIFVDWQMPGKDGIEIAQLIKGRDSDALNKASIVLMISSYDLEEVRSRAKLAGVDAFLPKPACPSQIFDTVANLYSRKGDPHKDAQIVINKERLDQVRGTHILLVEDNLFNQQVAQELLEQIDMKVEIAGSGFTALEMIEKKEYDLVLMDIQMPDLDGLEVCRRIRRHHSFSSLPIVAMTAHAMNEDRKKSIEAGMNDHITKPIDPEKLTALLIQWGNPQRGENTTELELPRKSECRNANDPDMTYRFAEIDHQAGLNRCSGNASSYLRFLGIFYRQYADLGRRCEAFMNDREYEEVKLLAHAVKAPAGSIGAHTLENAAHEFERVVRSGDEDLYPTRFQVFQQALETVVEDLAPLFCQEEDGIADVAFDGPIIDREKEKQLLEHLRACLEKNDVEAAAILSLLSTRLAGSDIVGEWRLLETQIRDFDFDEALETLSKVEECLETEGTVEDGNRQTQNSYC